MLSKRFTTSTYSRIWVISRLRSMPCFQASGSQ